MLKFASPLLLYRRVSMLELGLFMGVTLPRGLKFCLGQWSGKLPKIVLLSAWILMTALLSASSSAVEEAVRRGEIWKVFWPFLGLVTLCVIAEVAMESCMAQRRVRLQAAQMTGLNLGAVISFILFLPLQKPQGLLRAVLPQGTLTKFTLAAKPVISLSNLMQSTSVLAGVLAGCVMIPVENREACIRRVKSTAAAHAKSPWECEGSRPLLWLMLLSRAPFAAFEFLAPLQLLSAGLPLEYLAASRSLDFVSGVLSGATAMQPRDANDQKSLWMKAYVLRLCVGACIAYFVANLPPSLTVPEHLLHLAVYLVLVAASISTGNALCVSQSRLVESWMESQEVEVRSRAGVRSAMAAVYSLGSCLWRVVAYCAVDLASQRVCFRQQQRFEYVPCPLSPPFGLASNNLCTDSGGECRVEEDGFATVIYSTLAAGVVLGFTFNGALRQLPMADDPEET